MGKYDKEVSDAKKIIQDWIKGSKGYHDQFVTLKKNNLAWEKQSIQRARTLLDSGVAFTDEKSHNEVKYLVESGLENLELFAKEGLRIFNEHNKWAMGGPRDSFAAIASRLKFGKKGEPLFDGVQKELGSMLEPVSKGIRETESMWNKDLHFAIENQRIKLKAIGSELKKGSGARDEALAKQLKKGTAAFTEVVEKIVKGVMFFKDKDDWNRAKKGEFDERDPAGLKQKYEQYRNKVEVITAGAALIEKNLNRLQKSFPSGYLEGPGKTEFETLLKLKKDALLDLRRYSAYYGNVMKLFEEKGWKP